MALIELEELGGKTAALTDAQAAALAASGVVRVSRRRSGTWEVEPCGKVGVARVAGVEIRITPKIPIRRLLFLIGYARDQGGWRDEDVELADFPDLVPAAAHAFARQAERALAGGVLQGYRTVDDALPVVRGRIRQRDQVRRWGLPAPVEVSYDDFSVDIAENQLLRTAASELLALPGVPAAVRTRLRAIAHRLALATPLRRGRPLPAWRPTRLNARYHHAVRLAELVLRGRSFDQDWPGTVRVNGFLFDMVKVFEDFVTVALAEALRPYGGRCKAQARLHLTRERRVLLKPDLVWYATGDRPAAVVDAKYKAERTSGVPQQDLYQMLAYCTALGLPRGHLVYAKGQQPELTHHVRNSGVELVQHALDLEQDLPGLRGQVARIAEAIVSPSPGG
ncbi:McrC family protein [Carbonactinospora thermoautotrophica]|nr:hypothetical protein [Carbonactinospora thermoautotrophica]